MLHTLDQLTAVLECRKKRLEETECKDLDTYNEATGEGLPRLVFACDEVAEMLDKTGADNERKKLLAQIENKLSTIARQGRAFGIHLILATQRPDATIIPARYATTWISVFAAERIVCFLKSFSTTPAPPNRPVLPP